MYKRYVQCKLKMCPLGLAATAQFVSVCAGAAPAGFSAFHSLRSGLDGLSVGRSDHTNKVVGDFELVGNGRTGDALVAQALSLCHVCGGKRVCTCHGRSVDGRSASTSEGAGSPLGSIFST